MAIMAKLIRAFKTRSHVLLESPTGTGKTAALLCGALAWQRHVGVKSVGAQHRIIYCTRTHSQLDQVVNELRRSPYRPVMTVLASRKRLCIHKDVVGKNQSNFDITSICRNARRGGRNVGSSSGGSGDSTINVNNCVHWKNIGDEDYAKGIHQQLLPSRSPNDTGGVIDIEGLKEFGSAEKGCPYFTAQAIHQSGAQIIFCPYQYVINPGMRETLEIETEGSIIIVDEAHNIEDTCREAGSIEISLFTVMNVIKDLCISHACTLPAQHIQGPWREAGAAIF